MPDLDSSLADARSAVATFLGTADRAGSVWTVPRAPGKWSPSQVVEHVARIMEESANVVAGAPSKFPNLPGILRPVIRIIFFNRALRQAAFPKAKASGEFVPETGATTPAAGRARVEGALARFEQACRERAASGQPVESSIFGRVPLQDYVRFQELHVRHHNLQLRGAS
jgi:hypothetical protein